MQGADYNKEGNLERARSFGMVTFIYDMVIVALHAILYTLSFLSGIITMAVVLSEANFPL